MAKSPVAGKYDVTIDPNSAYEILQKRVQDAAAASPAAEGGQAPAPAGAGGGILGGLGTLIGGVFGTNNPARQTGKRTGARRRASSSTATTTCSRSIRSIYGKPRRSSRGSKTSPTGERSSSRAAPVTTKAKP
jgi:hypothetical protein